MTEPRVVSEGWMALVEGVLEGLLGACVTFWWFLRPSGIPVLDGQC